MIKVRLKFSKYGPIRFVGHLDVMRYFQKVMRRANIPIAYSEGYSPHQLMSFAQPLSVGATSDGEYLDIVLRDAASPGDAVIPGSGVIPSEVEGSLLARLNTVCHEGITITDAQVLPEKAEKAMTAVAACAWRVRLRDEVLQRVSQERFAVFLAQGQIPARKKSKKGLTGLNIKPMIHRASLADDGSFELLLKSGSEDNVKPALFLGAFLRFLGCDREDLYLQGDELKPECLSLHRRETYRAVADAEGIALEPLISREGMTVRIENQN